LGAWDGLLDPLFSYYTLKIANFNIIKLLTHLREQQAILSGKKAIEMGPMLLKESREKAILLVEHLAKPKDIQFSIEETGPNIVVLAEPVSCLNVVICNFLSNATKFSEKGSKIIFRLERAEHHATLSIVDHGVGIPSSIIKDLFLFQKETTKEGTSGGKGTGFGMPLAKAYMEAFGGAISVESRSIQEFPKDHGTTFKLKFKAA
jgi:signal transduction histidine kinase